MAKATTFTEGGLVAISWVLFTATTLLAEAAGGGGCDDTFADCVVLAGRNSDRAPGHRHSCLLWV